MVYVFCHATEPFLLVLRRDAWRNLRFTDPFQHGRAGIRYDGYVRGDLMEQWLKEKNHTSSLLGLAISLICLIAFGADNFIIPAMLAILVVLTMLRRPLETGGAASGNAEKDADGGDAGQCRIDISESGRGGEAQ